MILVKKVLRSIWRGKRSYLACIFLLALGVASYVGFTQGSLQLKAGMEHMYREQAFGQAFASVRGITPAAARSLEGVAGVERVSTRTVADTRYLVEDDRLLYLTLISHRPDQEEHNRFLLLEGHAPGQGEVLLSQGFASGQGLKIGDTIEVTAGGRTQRLTVCGTAISPEYISESDPGNAGYGYVPVAEARRMADTGELDNEVLITLEGGARFDTVEQPLAELLERYGLSALYGREDHPRHREAWLSVDSLTSTAAMIAFVFLGVAVLMLTILLRRVMEQERTQIGTMKAFGVSGGTLLAMYLGYGLAVGLAGGVLGWLVGQGISAWTVATFLTLFRMPGVIQGPAVDLLWKSLLLSGAAGAGGAAMGARSVLRLSPAESMRPAAPAVHRGRGMPGPKLPPVVSMAVRSIGRGKLRSAFVAGGLALSFAILSFMSSYASLMDEVLLTQFDYVQQYDMQLNLKEPRSYGQAVASAAGVPGVSQAEGVLVLEVTLRHGHLWVETGLTGLPREGEMRRLYDSPSATYRELPQEGLVLNQALARKLGAEVGDVVQVETDALGTEKKQVTVTGIVAENMGAAAYMELDGLCAMMGAERTANSLLLRVFDPAAAKEALTGAGNTAGLTDQADLRQAVQTMLDQTLGANVGIFAVIGLGVAFAVIMSTAAISLAERSREYATLRVLGMESRQIGATMVLEYLLLALAGFLPGIPLAIGLRALLGAAMGDETVALGLGIAPLHFMVGGAVCLLAVVLANLSSIRQIGRMEMTEVLRERE